MREGGIDAYYTGNIQREALKKFSYVSPIGAAGMYFNATAGDFQKAGEPRMWFIEMIREVMALAKAMGYPLQEDLVEVNLGILDTLPPEATTSMQRDYMRHRPCEAEGLINDVVKLAHQYDVSVPCYEEVMKKADSIT